MSPEVQNLFDNNDTTLDFRSLVIQRELTKAILKLDIRKDSHKLRVISNFVASLQVDS